MKRQIILEPHAGIIWMAKKQKKKDNTVGCKVEKIDENTMKEIIS